MGDDPLHAPAGENKRRKLFKWLAGAATGGVATAVLPASALTLPAQSVAAAGTAEGILWLHGHALNVEDPDIMDLDAVTGPVRRLRGASFSHNRLLFALPLFTQTGIRTRVRGLVLRTKTLPGAAITHIQLYDGETLVAELPDLMLQSPDWADLRLDFPSAPSMTRGFTLSMTVAFQATEREIHLAAVGCDVGLDALMDERTDNG